MLTKGKAMYQTWLIIEGLSVKERGMISQDLLDEIKNTMEYDENIKIDFSIPLENQNLDSQTWKMLDKVIKSAEKNRDNYSSNNLKVENSQTGELEKIKLENIALNKELEKFRDDSKELVLKYKDAYDQAIKENEKIKNDCSILIQTLKAIPGFIRKIFIKDEKIKLLISGK